MEDVSRTKSDAGKLGGLRRAETLSEDQRTEIAKGAANTRWGHSVQISGKRVSNEALGITVEGSDFVVTVRKRHLTGWHVDGPK